MSRLAIFIDGAYLDSILKEDLGGAKVDLKAFSTKLAIGVDLLRTYYYHCLPYRGAAPDPEEQERFSRAQRFFQVLRQLPRFEIRLGELAHRGLTREGKPVFVQKQVDILLGLDLALLSVKGRITHAALVAGDSDFLPAVRAAKDEGVLVHLFHGQSSPPHRSLWDACDERTRLDAAWMDEVRRKGSGAVS